MTARSTELCRVEAIVSNVADRVYSHGQGLAQLRARNFTPDSQVLADAVALLTIRDGLLDGTADPYDVLSLEPRLHQGDIREHAIDTYDGLLCDALRRLEKRPAVQVSA